jgi:hypothetical protein
MDGIDALAIISGEIIEPLRDASSAASPSKITDRSPGSDRQQGEQLDEEKATAIQAGIEGPHPVSPDVRGSAGLLRSAERDLATGKLSSSGWRSA